MCVTAQFDQSSLSAWRNFASFAMQTSPVKILFRLRESAGLSESSLGALVSDVAAQILTKNKFSNIGIKHGFSSIIIRQVPWEVLKTEAEGRCFQHLPRNLENVNALENHVRSLLLHKSWKYLLYVALFLALFCFAFSPMSRERYFHGLYSF